MTSIAISARCTREEYMTYCVQRAPKLPWVSVCGIGLLVLAAWQLSTYGTGRLAGAGILLLVTGLYCMILSPLIIPMVIKGEAGRRYDVSDNLSQAIRLVIDEQTLTVQSATVEGTLPLTAMTDRVVTSGMIALIFGNELTVCVPRRALSDEEQQTLLQILETVLKGNTHDE